MVFIRADPNRLVLVVGTFTAGVLKFLRSKSPDQREVLAIFCQILARWLTQKLLNLWVACFISTGESLLALHD